MQLRMGLIFLLSKFKMAIVRKENGKMNKNSFENFVLNSMFCALLDNLAFHKDTTGEKSASLLRNSYCDFNDSTR